MRRLGTICGVGAILAVCLASPAAATPPEHGTFIFPDEGTDPAGTTCAFAVHFSQVERLDFRAFFDRDGNFVKNIVHIDYDATISANGKTLVERDTFTRTFYADDTMRDAGLTVHIQGPGGSSCEMRGRSFTAIPTRRLRMCVDRTPNCSVRASATR